MARVLAGAQVRLRSAWALQASVLAPLARGEREPGLVRRELETWESLAPVLPLTEFQR
jgi:hypothetical protein